MSISFDGVNKLAILSSGTTSLTVPELWSRWVDWISVSDNSKYEVMMSQIGGDEISAGRYLGLTFFLENGWKIRPFEGDHALTISGNIFTRDGSQVTTSTIGDYNVIVNISTSNLIDAISTSGSTPASIADEVYNRLAISNIAPGSFGELFNMLKATTNLTAANVVILNTKLDEATAIIQTLLKYEANKTKINQTDKTLTVFDDDGITPLKVFDLKNFSGAPSITEIAERDPQ